MQVAWDSHASNEAAGGFDPAAGYAQYLDPTSLVLRAIAGLCSEGVPPEKVPYFTDHVSPLLNQIVEYLMQEMPANPIGALTLWLLSGSSPPAELWDRVSSFVNGVPMVDYALELVAEELQPQETAGAIESKATKVKVKSALKEAKGITEGNGRRGTAFVTPSGTTVSEERLRRVPPLLDEQKFAIVDSQPFFANLERCDKDDVVQALELEKHLDGEEVMKHGERASGMYIVVRGEGKIMVSHEIGCVKPGDIFGDQELIHGIPAHQTVEACGGHGLTTLKLPALVFKMMGLKRKVGMLHKRKAAKVRDDTAPEHEYHRQSSCNDDPAEYASCEEDIAMIRDVVARNDNLKEVLNFTHEQVDDICRLARKKHFQAGDVVFRKGEYGSIFYVIHDGVFRLTQGQVVTDEASGQGDVGYRLRAGASFGELSVMYNAPRSATVQCIKAGSCWLLSRAVFKDSMKTKMDGRINEYAELLRTVDIFSNMDLRQMAALCNTVEERYFFEYEDIVRQGEVADCFYIIFEGSCAVVIDGIETASLAQGNFFGEKALIEHDVRAATVRVTSDKCTVLALDRLAFEVLLLKNRQALAMEDMPASGVALAHTDENTELLSTLRTKLHEDGLQPQRRFVPMESLQHCGVLGRGAFGYVSLERDCETGELYALKAMSKGHIVQEKLKVAVCNEKSCMELVSSDFVVSLVNTYADEANVYLLLVPCFGGELFDVYSDHPQFFGSEVHCRFYSACVAMGLDHMHSRKIIYRDLKLENCLLTLTGYLKLTDLGIAKVCVGKTYTVCGTADYFAPETLRQTGHNRAVDWWALGVMMFIMVSGRSPFDAPDQMKIYRKIMKGFSKVSFPDECSETLPVLIRALCQKNAEERLTMGNLGVQNLKDHPWYRGFSWKDLTHQRMVAPWTPSRSEEEILAKAAANSVEALPSIPYEDDGSGWEEVFARGI